MSAYDYYVYAAWIIALLILAFYTAFLLYQGYKLRKRIALLERNRLMRYELEQ